MDCSISSKINYLIKGGGGMRVCKYGHVRPASEEDCGKCHKVYLKRYYQANAESLRAKARARYAANRADLIAYRAQTTTTESGK